MSLLIMLFSGVAYGDNLLIGGINQKGATIEENPEYQEIATSLKATYLPTYYRGLVDDVNEVRKAALGDGTVQNGLADQNGQPNKALNHHYETIVAYSGGTSTAVTALADKTKYGLTCDTLILVSPMAAEHSVVTLIDTVSDTTKAALIGGSGGNVVGGMVAGVTEATKSVKDADTEANAKFEERIITILKNNPDLKIIVIQSTDDKPTWFSGTYQYTFKEDNTLFKEYKNRIQITNAELTSTGEQAHKDLFFEYATSHLANDGSGITFSPTGQSIKPNPFEQRIANQEPQFPASSQPSETTPVAADVNSIGTPQSDVKFIKTPTPTSKILSNLNLEQGTTQTASQSTNAKSASVASSLSSSVQQAIDNMEPVGEYNHYESTIPIPIGPAADALKAQGKYEEYLENALQAAEDRTAQDSQDGDAWYTKGLALYYLNRDEEANVALAQAKELGIQFESNGESFTRVGQAEPINQATETTKSTDESNTGESTVIPTLYPITSPPPDESPLPPRTQSEKQRTIQTARSTNTKFSKGANIEVTDSLNVRDAPGTSSGTIISTKFAGNTATVLSGPYYADDFTWWEVQYDDGTKGFSQEKRLELMPTNTVGQPIITETSTDTPQSDTQGTTQTNIEESSAIPMLYPITSPPPDESNTKESSTASQSIDTKFGDTQLSVTQPVDPQPDLAFGQIFRNNQQTATSLSESAFGDSQPDLAFGNDQLQVTAPPGQSIAKPKVLQLSGTSIEDWGLENYHSDFSGWGMTYPSQPSQQELEDQQKRRLTSQEEENMVMRSGGTHRSLSPNVQQAIDNMQPVGEYNHYESTVPVFHLAGT
jgi:hypothetical protein